MRHSVVGVLSSLRGLWLLGFLAAIGPASTAFGAAPFVAGFDRFGRHAELDPSLAGQLLLSELSCTACHQSEDQELVAKAGPRLDGAGNRLNRDWLKQFLLSPQSTKPGTTMPDVLAGVPADDRPAVVEALLAFLESQREDFPELKVGGANPVPHEFWNKGDAALGRELYHRVGCVACHDPDPAYETVETKPSPLDELLEQLDPEELAELGLASAVRPVNSVPHPKLPQKYTRQSLTFFLIDPESTRRSGRMPNLKLEPMDAAHITAWLMRDQAETARPGTTPTDELVHRGRQLFAELRCANCHSAADIKPVAAKPLAELKPDEDIRCWGEPAAGLPHYQLDAAQVAAIQSALLPEGHRPPGTAQEQAHFRMLQLNCYACHERDKVGGVGRNRRPFFETVGNIDIGDEGRIPPPLTGVGWKLLTPWMKRVLDGNGDVRPHMLARMPKFPAKMVSALPQQLATADRRPDADKKTLPKATKEMTVDGRALVDVGCVQCHSFRGDALPGVVGIDLDGVNDRLHPDWFQAFLLNPTDLKPRTRMPSFFPGGKSQQPDVLEGDTQRQIAAMWAYLRAGDNQPLPQKIEEALNQNYELTPSERPLMLRTFMPVAGMHAIAVGFPQGVNIAFDAEQVRLAQAWKGRFLSAQGTWFSRFAPPAEPLGDSLITLPPGPLLAFLQSDAAPWPTQQQATSFDGYRLDAEGVPAFLSHIGSLQVEERITPGSDATLVRQLSLASTEESSETLPLFVRLHVGKTLKRVGDRAYVDENGLTVSADTSHAGELRQTAGHVEWIIPLDPTTDTTIKVSYSW